jgi:hypothetical protein
MPNRQRKFVSREPDRHGTERLYFRRRGSPRIRVRHDPSTPEFAEAYAAFIRGDLDHPSLCPPKHTLTKSAYVYCIGSIKGPFKVGVTTDAALRLKDIQVGNPKQLAIVRLFELASTDVAFAVEAAAHLSLQNHRLNGEWFAASVKAITAAISNSAFALGHPARDIPVQRKMNICVAPE